LRRIADPTTRQRKLDDEELDSGDDEDRHDRALRDTPDIETQHQNFTFEDAEIARHPVPEPSDGELYLLKIPVFMSLDPTAFSHKTFQPPTTDHHSNKPASDHFSAYNTAMTTIRWRHSPSDPSKLQSNARILRWSDGSLTLQHANDPTNQYEINAQVLAPPQVNPVVPTPTMAKGRRKDDQNKESYTYLVAPCEGPNVLRVTNKLTSYLTVAATSNTKDVALEKLQNDLAAAASRGRDDANQAISFIDVSEDPELRRQREEVQYKERLKQQRARERHVQKEQERSARVTGRPRGGYGLDADLLEGGEGRRRGGAKKPRAQARRGQQDYSDEDEDEAYARRGNKEDEYDDSDDFIANSDEEEEVVDDDEDEDDGIIEEGRSRNLGDQSPKRSRGADDDDDDEDVRAPSKKRRVVIDDDEDEE
jgi:RNA polymerase-associated protein LEO1